MEKLDKNLDNAVDIKKEDDVAETENRNFKFIKPYVFEGKTYNEIDLSGLDELTIDDMVKVEKIVLKASEMPSTVEMTLGYAIEMATRVTDQPREFFLNLPSREGTRFKMFMTNFFYQRG